MISVCMATYNGSLYLREQINSILKQLSPTDELIVSDDGSTDETMDILAEYQDSRIKIYRNKAPHGVVMNFENAINQSIGDYIFLSDQDDIWMPDKVKIMVQKLQSFDLVVSDAQLVNGENMEIFPSFFGLRDSDRGFWKNMYKNTYLGCCIAFRKDILEYILPFPKKIAMHDIWIGLCIEIFGSPLFLNKTLIQYRRHGRNTSSAGEKSNYKLGYQLSYRLYLLWSLMKRRMQKISFLK